MGFDEDELDKKDKHITNVLADIVKEKNIELKKTFSFPSLKKTSFPVTQKRAELKSK